MMTAWLKLVFIAGQSDGSILEIADPQAEAAAALALLEGAQLAARAEENTDRFEGAVHLMQLRLK